MATRLDNAALDNNFSKNSSSSKATTQAKTNPDLPKLNNQPNLIDLNTVLAKGRSQYLIVL